MDPFLQYMPSVVAAAAYNLATYTVNRTLWVRLFRLFYCRIVRNRLLNGSVELSLFSQLCLGFFSQPQALHAFTGYAVEDILPCLTDLHKLYMSAESRPQQAIREKFKSSK